MIFLYLHLFFVNSYILDSPDSFEALICSYFFNTKFHQILENLENYFLYFFYLESLCCYKTFFKFVCIFEMKFSRFFSLFESYRSFITLCFYLDFFKFL